MNRSLSENSVHRKRSHEDGSKNKKAEFELLPNRAKQRIKRKELEKKSRQEKQENKNQNKVLQTEKYKDSQEGDSKKLVVIKKEKKNPNPRETKQKSPNDVFDSTLASGKERQAELEPKSVLGKRKFEQFTTEDQNFLCFGSKDEEDEVEGVQSIEDSFRQLKKLKTENEGYKNEKTHLKPLENRADEENEKVLAPWMSKSTSKIENTTIRFHNEIIDFVEYIGPSQKEDTLRKKSFEKLSEFIKEILPNATVKPFGSFITNLYLPQSDIDVAVIESTFGAQTLLNKVAKAFMKTSDYECINVIRSAKVPLVKIVERKTGIHFDISFNKMDGINQVKEIEKALEFYPEMKYLILVMKCFLKQRDFNETFQGGVGSFLLFCLILAFLREVRRDYKINEKEDDVDRILLSEFVLKFLDFYGNFDLVRKQIILSNGGGVVDKYIKDFSLSVLSPQDNSHDLGKAVFKAREVFGIFKNRYHFMVNYNFKSGESVLKYLINSNLT